MSGALSSNNNDCVSFFPDQCTGPLGMETGEILDSDITASSSFDAGNVGPQIGRFVYILWPSLYHILYPISYLFKFSLATFRFPSLNLKFCEFISCQYYTAGINPGNTTKLKALKYRESQRL